MNQPASPLVSSEFQPESVRGDFPNLACKVNGKPLIYFDNAASAQRPRAMLNAIEHYYTCSNANVHRGVHSLSQAATDAFEAARETMRRFIGAGSHEEVIFVRGATEAVNLVSQAYLRPLIKSGEQILISHMEHHSNIVPWQLLCEQSGAELKVIPVTPAGEIDLDAFEQLLGPKVRILAVVHASNALGTINPIKQMIASAHAHDIPVLIDGAQAAPHLAVDVVDLDCDFYCVSGHKMFGPTGIGVLYGKREHLQAMPPYHGGGEMIQVVSFDGTTYNDLPYKFEAGTPNIAGAIGLGASANYLLDLGWEGVQHHEAKLLAHLTSAIEQIPGLRIIGQAADKVPLVSFVVDGIHPNDLGTILDHQGVAIRTGHHCTMPLMQMFGLPGTCRASLAFYNTHEEVDQFIVALQRAVKMLSC